MSSTPLVRTTSVALAGLVLALGLSMSAMFEASRPGADLAPMNGAGNLIQILQGNQNVLWTSLSGNVTSYVVQGWPTRTGDTELGGALMMERPADGSAGVIDFGEKPMSLEFQVDR